MTRSTAWRSPCLVRLAEQSLEVCSLTQILSFADRQDAQGHQDDCSTTLGAQRCLGGLLAW